MLISILQLYFCWHVTKFLDLIQEYTFSCRGTDFHICLFTAAHTGLFRHSLLSCPSHFELAFAVEVVSRALILTI